MQNSLTGKLTTTRGGTIALGVLAALAAGILLIVYLQSYRSSVDARNASTPVLVAKSLIPAGTSGTLIGQKELYQVSETAKDDVNPGAVSDPAYLEGRVVTKDIFPNQQITTADLTASAASALQNTLAGTFRAVALPIDAAGGLGGFLKAGDRVDAYAALNVATGSSSRGVVQLIVPNLVVLAAPAGSGESDVVAEAETVVLRATSHQAAKLAFASQNGRLWLFLRPSVGATAPPRAPVTMSTLFLGVPGAPVQAGSGG